MSFKLNLAELESLRSELVERSFDTSFNSLKLYFFYDYFNKILSFNNPNLEEAFLKEFLEDYLFSLSRFEVWGVNPDFSHNVILQLNRLAESKHLITNPDFIKVQIQKLEKQLSEQKSILNGEKISESGQSKTFFPLLIADAPAEIKGIIESISIHISKSTEDKIIIVPSEKEIDKRISEQCNHSWRLAISLLKQYVKKPNEHHEIIINFDKREGFYEGNSLGIALALSLLEALLKFYNPPYEINIKHRIAFTGGVTETGSVVSTGEEIIKQKIEIIFYSGINSFVIPKQDEHSAYTKLKHLQTLYPNRELKLIPVEDFNDIINRRDIVEIKKRNPVVRTGRFVKKNWISAAATVVLAVLFAYLFVVDFDDNPAILTTDGNLLFVKNKSGKILWTKNIMISEEQGKDKEIFDLFARIIDINQDGYNEILLINEKEFLKNQAITRSKLNCYDKDGKKIWQFEFKDEVSSERENLEPFYMITLIDTLTLYNQKALLLYSNNSPSFSSAIYKINLLTGERIAGTIWCSGHFQDALIKDLNNDGKKDVLGIGLDNGFEEQIIFGITIDSTSAVRLSTKDYTIKNYPLAIPILYIRIPKTDFTKYYNIRMSGNALGSLFDNLTEKKYRFVAGVKKEISQGNLWVMLDYNLMDMNFSIDDDFRIRRDSLVANGKLRLPYTDTKEYKDILKKNTLYWKPDTLSDEKGKWVRREELID